MTEVMQRIWAYFWLPETKYVIATVVIFALLSLRLLPRERRRVGGTVVVFGLCLVGQLFGALRNSSVPCSRRSTIRASR